MERQLLNCALHLIYNLVDDALLLFTMRALLLAKLERQSLKELLLPLRQRCWCFDLNLHMQIARTQSLQPGHAFSP